MSTRCPSARTAALAVFHDTPQALGDPGDTQVLTHDPFQRPPQATPRQLGPRLRGLAGVLAPHMTTADAAVAADRDQQHRGTPPERFVRQPARERIPRDALTPANGGTTRLAR